MENKPHDQPETVDLNFEIEQDAENILKSLLPKRWVVRKEDPDYHLDFNVEVVMEGELSGIRFGIQLKGTRPETPSDFQLKYALKTKHLQYY